MSGQVVGELWEGERSFDIVPRLPEAKRDTVEEISALRVPTPTGALVPLTSLADVIVDHGQASIDQAVLKGSRDRLRAVLMTAALAAFGLVPAALSKAMGAETQRPIAVVIVGGTVSAALLTLIVLPVAYRVMFALRARWPKPAGGAETLSRAASLES